MHAFVPGLMNTVVLFARLTNQRLRSVSSARLGSARLKVIDDISDCERFETGYLFLEVISLGEVMKMFL